MRSPQGLLGNIVDRDLQMDLLRSLCDDMIGRVPTPLPPQGYPKRRELCGSACLVCLPHSWALVLGVNQRLGRNFRTVSYSWSHQKLPFITLPGPAASGSEPLARFVTGERGGLSHAVGVRSTVSLH